MVWCFCLVGLLGLPDCLLVWLVDCSWVTFYGGYLLVRLGGFRCWVVWTLMFLGWFMWFFLLACGIASLLFVSGMFLVWCFWLGYGGFRLRAFDYSVMLCFRFCLFFYNYYFGFICVGVVCCFGVSGLGLVFAFGVFLVSWQFVDG